MALNGNSDTSGYNSVILNTTKLPVADYIKAVMPPIGSILPWHKSLTGCPSLPDGWEECDGTQISDSDSPYDGEYLPDLNTDIETAQGGRFLRGATTSGTLQASQNALHEHTYDHLDNTDGIDSLNQRDAIDGAGWTISASSGGDEARPNNIWMVMIMRIK